VSFCCAGDNLDGYPPHIFPNIVGTLDATAWNTCLLERRSLARYHTKASDFVSSGAGEKSSVIKTDPLIEFADFVSALLQSESKPVSHPTTAPFVDDIRTGNEDKDHFP
jgi:hypothetical protein